MSIHLKVCNKKGDNSNGSHVQPKKSNLDMLTQQTAIEANDSGIVSYQQCGAVYMSPYVRWHAYKINNTDTHSTRSNDDEQKMSETLIVSE